MQDAPQVRGGRRPRGGPVIAEVLGVDAGPGMVLLLVAVGFAAGLIDAVVGGGGLVQLPVLLSAMPGATAVPLGVNKSVSAVGNIASAAVYWRRNPGSRIDLRLLAWSGAPRWAAPCWAPGLPPPSRWRCSGRWSSRRCSRCSCSPSAAG
ncbi:TSUP family transporter [Nocardiopsis composta]